MTTPTSERLRKDRLRAPRLRPDPNLEVRAKTLGTTIDYSFNTSNISRTGLLLRQAQQCRVPFLVNTLVEVIIDSGQNWLPHPIECIAKVVRIVSDQSSEQFGDEFGLQIVQIEKASSGAWEKSVDRLAEMLGLGADLIFKNQPRMAS